MSILFVYGSLMRGFPNHRILVDARYTGVAITRPEFELLDFGAFPALVPGKRAISGEAYDVDGSVIARCDRLEGHPHFYVRQRAIISSGLSAPCAAWLYVLSQANADREKMRPRIVSGSWRTYTQTPVPS